MNEAIEEAINLVENGQVDEGLNHLYKLKESVKNHDDKLLIADLFLKWGFLDEAKEIIFELLELYPDEGQLYIDAAEILIEQDNEEDALEYLEEIKEGDPAYLQALVIMADLLQMQGLDEAAEQKLLMAKKLAPNESLIDLGLGQFYADIGEYQKAIPYYEKVLADGSEVEQINIYILLADAFVHIGKFEEALENYEKGLQQRIEINALFHYAFTAFQLERYELAIAKWNELKDLDEEYVALYLYLAKANEHIGALNESYKTIQQGLELDPNNKELLVYAGKMAMKLQKHEEVEGYLLNATNVDNGYIEAINLLSSYYLNSYQYDKVIENIERAIDTGEFDPQFEWDLATAKKHIDDYNHALIHYENAYTSFKENIQFLEDFGYFLLEEGNRDRAKEIFKIVLVLDPANVEIEQELYRLEEL